MSTFPPAPLPFLTQKTLAKEPSEGVLTAVTNGAQLPAVGLSKKLVRATLAEFVQVPSVNQ